jgi:hypothetical protein
MDSKIVITRTTKVLEDIQGRSDREASRMVQVLSLEVEDSLEDQAGYRSTILGRTCSIILRDPYFRIAQTREVLEAAINKAQAFDLLRVIIRTLYSPEANKTEDRTQVALDLLRILKMGRMGDSSRKNRATEEKIVGTRTMMITMLKRKSRKMRIMPVERTLMLSTMTSRATVNHLLESISHSLAEPPEKYFDNFDLEDYMRRRDQL